MASGARTIGSIASLIGSPLCRSLRKSVRRSISLFLRFVKPRIFFYASAVAANFVVPNRSSPPSGNIKCAANASNSEVSTLIRSHTFKVTLQIGKRFWLDAKIYDHHLFAFDQKSSARDVWLLNYIGFWLKFASRAAPFPNMIKYIIMLGIGE
jgi:hypothetical protein